MPAQTSTPPNAPLVLNRGILRIGKYTRWAANLTEDELYGLLWLLGEFGIRTSASNLLDMVQEKGRARTGLLGALSFVHGTPMSKDEALSAIRNAFKEDISCASEHQSMQRTNEPGNLEDSEG